MELEEYIKESTRQRSNPLPAVCDHREAVESKQLWKAGCLGCVGVCVCVCVCVL